jgi:hypothetical protein
MVVMKYLIVIPLMLMFGVQQALAYTLFEYHIANDPYPFQNLTYSARNQLTDDKYEWIELDGKIISRLEGARDASLDPEVVDLEPASCCGYGTYALFVIDRTLEPGTPLTMCVSYDNIEKCEQESIAKGTHNIAVLEVDFYANKTLH